MSKVIFLIQNGVDFLNLLNQIKKTPSHIIYSLDYESHKLLEKKKIVHKIGEDVLTSADFDKIDSNTINCMKNYFNSHKEILTFEGIFLPELIEHEFFHYLNFQTFTAYVILKILENEKASLVIDFTNFGDYIKKITSFKKIKHTHFVITKNPSLYHDNIKVNFNLGKIPVNLALSRKTFSRIKNPIQKFTNEIYNLKPNTQNKKNILLVSFDPLQYEEMLMEFKRKNINFLLLNLRKPAITNKKSLNIIKNSESKIVDLNQFSKYVKSDILFAQKKLENVIQNIFNDDLSFEKLFTVDKFSFWFSIKNSFRKICSSRFGESIQRIYLLNQLFTKFDISKILQWAEVGQEEKECVLVGKKFNIPSFMLQHGRYQNSKTWDKFSQFLGRFPTPLLSDKQIVWGEITKKYALSYNHSATNILVGGSPRHDKFFNLPPVNNKKSGIILLATTGTHYISADSCTTSSQIKYDEYIKEVYRIVKSLPEKKIILKPHPSPILTKLAENLINEIDPSIRIIKNVELHKLINDCEVLITFNNSTTTLDAISMNKPVISLQTDSYANDDDIVKAGAVLSISEIKDLESGLKKILYDNSFRKKLMEKSTSFLQKYMKNQGCASESIVDILSKNI
tara:strand:- start:732 stop:2603 length:1872 start_codon:yes stop_codon:yes gene_type:complete